MSIFVTKAPSGNLNTLSFVDGTTVAEACRKAGLDYSGYETRVNGQPAELDDVLDDNDQVLLVEKVKGA